MTPLQQREYDYRFTERVAIIMADFDETKGSKRNATRKAEALAKEECDKWLEEQNKFKLET